MAFLYFFFTILILHYITIPSQIGDGSNQTQKHIFMGYVKNIYLGRSSAQHPVLALPSQFLPLSLSLLNPKMSQFKFTCFDKR